LPEVKKSSPVTPDMNVTPLVDVVLVLLIIFMVVAPRMDQDLPVELPGIFNPDPEIENQVDPFKVSVSSTGEFSFDQKTYTLDEAVEALAWKHAEEPLRRLVLRADRRLTYGQVREILARTQQVGFPGMSLMVGEKNRTDQDDAAMPSEAASHQPAKSSEEG
jgi:biopolymer transport protein ExbD